MRLKRGFGCSAHCCRGGWFLEFFSRLIILRCCCCVRLLYREYSRALTNVCLWSSGSDSSSSSSSFVLIDGRGDIEGRTHHRFPKMRLSTLLLPLLTFLPSTFSQSTDPEGYTDYSLSIEDTPEGSVLYETASTPANTNLSLTPDVFLNATVSVGEISLLVANLSAQINIDAQVLNLLTFNAGVDLSIGRVRLVLQNVTARVRLEARLGNLVRMVEQVLDSVDLNPVLATVGEAVGDLAEAVGGGSTAAENGTSSDLNARGLGVGLQNLEFDQGILYSINDYSGNTHTNRILAQNGDLLDQSLDNDGFVFNAQVVGSYDTEMTATGRVREGVIIDGVRTREEEYVYLPVPGLEVVCKVYVGDGGDVVATRVFVEIEGGGNSSISADVEVEVDEED